MNDSYTIIRKTNLFCPECGHPLIIAKIDNMNTLYCEKCKEDIYEDDIYDKREQTYRINNRRKSLEDLL